MERRKYTVLALSAALSAALLGACERPSGRAIASPPEGAARSSGSVAKLDEPPRDSAAAAREPTPAAIVPQARDAISDTVITGRIKAAILGDPGMAGADVSVNTDHGVVILAGSVKSYDQAGIASAYAQRQDNVMRVDNQLTLAGS
ncbi:MAG: BON domain-containing protein [Pseudomonadota bacterium]|nr:BON domain-containing protein [Pseudomonadota bacterium]